MLKYLLLCFCLTFSNPTAISSSADSTELHLGKLSLVGATVATSFAGSYYLVLKNGWWNEQGQEFHFENDFEYALNLDKLGHFYGGYLISELFRDGLQWSGVSETPSYIWAGGLSSLVQVAIDIKDGYAPSWGYSIWDVGAGTLGGFFPMLQRYVPGFDYLTLKFSYWKNSDAYWVDHGGSTHIDDYVNQSYWISLDLHRWLGSPNYFPDWLQPSFGMSINEEPYTIGPGHGHWEFYVSLDWNMPAWLKPKSHHGQRWVHYLNTWKFPSPTLQFYPHWELSLAYPILF